MADPLDTFVSDVEEALKVVYGGAAEDVNTGGLSFDYLDANAAKYARERGGELIGTNDNAWSVEQTTRDEVNRLLQEAMADGLSPQEFADRLEESGLFGATRAEVIARTEVAIAQNYGQGETYRELGFTHVYVQDGDCDICREVDGAVWTIEEALDNPVAHPNAIFSGTSVLTLGSVRTGYKARWSGPARYMATASDNRLTVSANHPVLTDRGWVPAHEVRKGDYVVSRCGMNPLLGSSDAYLYKAPSLVEQIFDALATDGPATLCPAAPAHFHGDGNFCEGYVEVVGTDRLLSGVWDAPFLKDGHELIFAPAGVEPETLSCDGALDLRGKRVALPAPRGVSLRDVGRIRIARAQDYPACLQPAPDDQIADADFLRELESRFAVKVTLDQVVEVGDVEGFSSHAFDLTTGFGAYFANGILTHNCVRSFSPVEMD